MRKQKRPGGDGLEENLRWLLAQRAEDCEQRRSLEEAGVKQVSWALALALTLLRKATAGDLAAIREVKGLTQSLEPSSQSASPVQIINDLGGKGEEAGK